MSDAAVIVALVLCRVVDGFVAMPFERLHALMLVGFWSFVFLAGVIALLLPAPGRGKGGRA